MGDLAVSTTGVSKRFLNHTQRATSLKERLVRRHRASSSEFWALRDITVGIRKGESVGLMGANGSGKSTLLKVMAEILRPTTGTVKTHGRIASLLELGAGFNGELSGRDNIYLNASLLGLTRRETESLFDAIVDFSELGSFIDGPVKHYSSGMYVRLGFAVAVHVDPEILLVDEVLAVGDEHFQRKCLDKINEFQDDGRTILFVSHSSAMVEKVCSRAVVLDHGQQVFDGDPYFASAELARLLGTDLPSDAEDIVGEDLSFGTVVFSGSIGGPAIETVAPGDPIVISVPLTIGAHCVDEVAQVRLVVNGVGDIPIWSMSIPSDQLPDHPGDWVLDFVAPECPPLGGRFVADIYLLDSREGTIGMHRTAHAFEVQHSHRGTLLNVPYNTSARVKSDASARST